MEIFTLVVGAGFVACMLAVWFCWGIYRLEKRGPDAPLGKAGWAALFWPPAICCACLLLARAGLEGQRLVVLPIAPTGPTYVIGDRHIPAPPQALPKDVEAPQ